MWWITASRLLAKGTCSHLKVTHTLLDVWQASKTSHSKSTSANYQHQYLTELLVNMYRYHLMVKSVSCCCVRGRLLFSNPITNYDLVSCTSLHNFKAIGKHLHIYSHFMKYTQNFHLCYTYCSCFEVTAKSKQCIPEPTLELSLCDYLNNPIARIVFVGMMLH